MKTKSFKFINTVGHGYLVVPNVVIKPYLQHLVDTKALDDVAYSFWNKKTCQLEEDVEAYKFLEWFKSTTNKTPVIKETHQDSIRKYRPLKWVVELDLAENSNWVL